MKDGEVDDLMDALRDLYQNGGKLDKEKSDFAVPGDEAKQGDSETMEFSEAELNAAAEQDQPSPEDPLKDADNAELQALQNLMNGDAEEEVPSEEFKFDEMAVEEIASTPAAQSEPQPAQTVVDESEGHHEDVSTRPTIIAEPLGRKDTATVHENVFAEMAEEGHEDVSIDEVLQQFPSQTSIPTRMQSSESKARAEMEQNEAVPERKVKEEPAFKPEHGIPVGERLTVDDSSLRPKYSTPATQYTETDRKRASIVGQAINAAFTKNRPGINAPDEEGESREEFFSKISSIEKFNLAFVINDRSQIAEEFRILRARLMQYKFPPKKRSVMLTSCHHGEGKTSTGLHLALFIAKDLKKKVLLVDCDLRRPRVAYQLGIKTEYDIEDVLLGKATLEQGIVYSKAHNLYALVANKDYPHASEMLESQAMTDLVNRVHRNFDFVVFDTCPILSTADPAIIGPKVGGVLVIIQTRKTQRESIFHAADLLREAGAPIIGTVLTFIKFDMPKYFYRYQYYHSYYYYDTK